MSSADDFFRASTPSAKFPTVGTTVAGTIVSIGEARQAKDFASGALKTWDDGSPIMQLPIELKTNDRDASVPDDDGTRTLWVQQGSQMQKAIGAALRASNSRLEVGGKLAVTYTEDGTPKQRGFNPPKIYDAHYQPATKAAAFFADPPAPATSAAVSVVPAAAPAPDPAAVAAAVAQLSPEQRRALGI